MKFKREAAVLATAVMAQALVLYRAFHDGPMVGLIPWDDCLTLQRGLANLAVLVHAGSLWGALASLLALVIHSPISDLQAMAGLALTGGASWGPFALSVLALLLALYAVLFRPGRPALPLFLALLTFILVQQPTINALSLLKADWKGGLLIASALYLLHEAVIQDRRDLKLFGAGVLGLAISAKLTAFYMPVFAVAALAGFEALGFIAARAADPRLTRAEYLTQIRPDISRCLILALGPFLAFFILGAVGHHHLIGYILFALSDTWSDGLTPAGRALFYSPFGRASAWGHLHLFLLAFAALALVMAFRARDRIYPAALALCGLLALLLLAPLLTAHTSSWDFGASFLGVIMGATLISMTAAARALPRWGGGAILAVTLALALTAPLRPDLSDPAVGQPTRAELTGLKATYQAITAEIEGRTAKPVPTVRVFYEQSFAPFPNLSLLHFARTGEPMDVDWIADLAQADAVRAALTGADFLMTLVPSPGVRIRGLPQRFPTAADPAGADRFVAAQPGFAVARAFPVEGGEIRLYQRRTTPLTTPHR